MDNGIMLASMSDSPRHCNIYDILTRRSYKSSTTDSQALFYHWFDLNKCICKYYNIITYTYPSYFRSQARNIPIRI